MAKFLVVKAETKISGLSVIGAGETHAYDPKKNFAQRRHSHVYHIEFGLYDRSQD